MRTVRGVPGGEAAHWKSNENSSRAVREYLDPLEVANPSEVPPKSVSLTDPAARHTAAPGSPAFYAYSTNYLVDVDAGIIVDVEATPAFRTDEVNSTGHKAAKPTKNAGQLSVGINIPGSSTTYGDSVPSLNCLRSNAKPSRPYPEAVKPA